MVQAGKKSHPMKPKYQSDYKPNEHDPHNDGKASCILNSYRFNLNEEPCT